MQCHLIYKWWVWAKVFLSPSPARFPSVALPPGSRATLVSLRIIQMWHSLLSTWEAVVSFWSSDHLSSRFPDQPNIGNLRVFLACQKGSPCNVPMYFSSFIRLYTPSICLYKLSVKACTMHWALRKYSVTSSESMKKTLTIQNCVKLKRSINTFKGTLCVHCNN